MPGISIVIACRDEADTLWFTLHSLQMHTRGSLVERDGMEIVVADNDPGAKTCGKTVQEVCAAFAKARFPVRYLAAGEVKSVFFPRNQGAAAAQGEHLIFLDSHVLLAPYTIEALHRLFLNRSGLHTHALTPDLYLAHIPIAFNDPSWLFGPYKLRLRDDFWGEWTPMSTDAAAHEWQRPEGRHVPDRSERPLVLLHAEGRVGGRPRLQPEFPGLCRRRGLPRAQVLAARRTCRAPPRQENEQEPVSGVHWSAPRRYRIPWEE